MSFNAYQYANTFEKLACKIIAHEISKDIIVSGITKRTRDGGIDAIIHTKNNYITIEAKLRQNTVSLGLKDIATSVIFYLLRLNDKHYIVTNVYLSSETIDVLNQLNKTKDCELCYIDGNNTIRILKELIESLDDEEKELAYILLQEFSDKKKINKEERQHKNQNNICVLLETQDSIFTSINKTLRNGQKCVLLSGKLGTGKTVIAKKIEETISDSHKIIYIDCQQYNTIESFMYQISNIQLGIDINDLINEYICLSNDWEDNSNIVGIENNDLLNVLAQVLSRKPYNNSIKFLAQKYIDKIIDDFNTKKVCIIVDNYSVATPELDDFISSYILSSTEKLQFFIIKDTDYNYTDSPRLDEIIRAPANVNLFKEFETHEVDFTETNIFIDYLSPNIPHVYKQSLYSYFGGNLQLIKMAINEMDLKNSYNSSLLRPFGYEEFYKKKLFHFLSLDATYIKAFFVCWIMNSVVKYNTIALIEENDCINKLLKTCLFDDTNTSLKLNSICAYNIISRYFIKHGFEIYKIISDYIGKIKELDLDEIAKIRIAFIEQSKDFTNVSKHAIEQFENKLEYENIVETYVLLYIYTHNYINNKIEQIEATANLIYAIIDYNIYKFRFDINVVEIENELQTYFQEIEELENFEKLKPIEKNCVSEARIKYALYLYFVNKRKNNFKQAFNCLNVPDEYLLNCKNHVLISKIIRFKAICQKEMGDRNNFFKTLFTATNKYPDNKYLLSVYNANLAAYKSLEDSPIKAFEIVNEIAMPAAKLTDEHLHLWLMNDKLIYGIQAKKYNDIQVEKDYNSIMSKAEYLCSMTDKARAYNSYGAFCLQSTGDNNMACKNFKNALFIISKYETNNIMIYFAINYLQMIRSDECEEFNNVSELIFNWCKNNSEYIINKIKDPFIQPGNNKLILALYSFADLLKTRNDPKYQMLIKMEGISDIFKNRTSMNKLFYINGIPIILF